MFNWKHIITFVLVSFLSACNSSDESDKPLPVTPPVDLSGVWVGTWSGIDPLVGQVSGNWEADLTQKNTSVTGNGFLSGDVDCTDGPITGSLDKEYIITGNFVRDPCGTNEWIITALTLLGREVSGGWTKSVDNAEGTFSGIQVATPEGPRIRYFYPPGGLPGTVVSITGDRFSLVPGDSELTFSDVVPVESLKVRDRGRMVVRVPNGADIGRMTLTTSEGVAYSPWAFNTVVAHPAPEEIVTTIPVSYQPKDIAFTPDGRRGFILFSGVYGRYVGMIDVASATVINYYDLVNLAQSIVISPDGRYAYILTSNNIAVLHTGRNVVVDSIALPGINTNAINPDGLAITPDGKYLLVSNHYDGGKVSVIHIDTKVVKHNQHFNPGTKPSGIVVNPDGIHAYIAVHGVGQVIELNLDDYMVTGTFDVGQQPTGLAITPDGQKLYVSNTLDDTLSMVDLHTKVVTGTVAVGIEPIGIVISPDGLRAYTANYASNSVSLLDTTNDSVFNELPVGSMPISIAVVPDGVRAYVASTGSYYLYQVGGPYTLTVTKGGGGIGSVHSSPAGINCGSKCRSEYPSGTSVNLYASASSGSYFYGWGGDLDCSDGNVVMDASKNCQAIFYNSYSSSGGGSTRCFIATAAYGSYLDPHVMALRKFRDQYLLSTSIGRALVEFYYEYSPPVANYIRQHDALRMVVKMLLTPIVYVISYPLISMAVLLIIAMAIWIRFARLCRHT